MSDNWTFKDLKKWDDIIVKKANEYGLDWHPINYEVCDYYEMIGHMSYHGMPSHYNHWSYGKPFEMTHQSYNTEISKTAWLFAKLQPGRARKRINTT